MTNPDRGLDKPHSVDAERAFLGGIILNNNLAAQAIDLIDVPDLYVPSHRRIYQAERDLFSVDQPIEPITIANELSKEGVLEMVGGLSYITNLTYGVPHSSSVAHYAKIIKGKALLRAVIGAGEKMVEEAYEEDEEPRLVVDHAQSAVLALEEVKGGRTVENIHQVAAETRARLEALKRGENPAIASPWKKLNGLTRGGIHKTELWGLSAIQKMGKSATLKQWAAANNRNKIRTLIFSREMSSVQIMYRMLAAETGITGSQIRYGLDAERIDRLVEATREIEKGDSLFFDTKTSSITETRTKVREMVRLEGIQMVAWDYAQCFGAGKKTYSRADEVSAVWRGMKDMVQDFDLAGFAVAQFNREAVKGDDRPKFHQTEGSGEAEKAVSVGIVLNTEFAKGVAGSRPAKFYIDYQRDESAGGEVDLIFNGRIMEFFELPDPEPERRAEQSELDLNA